MEISEDLRLKIEEKHRTDDIKKEAQLRRLITKSQFETAIQQRSNNWKRFKVIIASPRYQSR